MDGILYISSVSMSVSPGIQSEIHGIWTGSDSPPNRIKSFYVDNNSNLVKEIYTLSEASYSTGSVYPSAGQSIVSYMLVDKSNVSSTEIVSDYFLGEDDNEYIIWNSTFLGYM